MQVRGREADVERRVEVTLAAAARGHGLERALELRQEVGVATQQRADVGRTWRVQEQREVAAVDPQVLEGDEVGGVVGQARREEGAVDSAGARADDDVDLDHDVELAAQLDPLGLRERVALAGADRAQQLVGHPADPDGQAHATVEREPEPYLAKHRTSLTRRSQLRAV